MAAVHADLTWLAVIAVIFAAVSAYYYLRIVMVMYMRDPDPSIIPEPRFEHSPALSIVLACALAGGGVDRAVSQYPGITGNGGRSAHELTDSTSCGVAHVYVP